MSAEPVRPSAAEAFDAAMAQLGRARGLFLGPLTETKKLLLIKRLRAGAHDLAIAYGTIAAAKAEADPLPRASLPPQGEATRRVLVERMGVIAIADLATERQRRHRPF